MKGMILFGVTGLFAVAAPAVAQMPVVTGDRSDDERYTRVVRFADLDIASTAGQTMLNRRVRWAINYVCASAGNFPSESRCVNYAWGGARPQLTRAMELARVNPTLAMASLATITISAPR